MKTLRIGNKVTASAAYARKCSNRFDKAGDWNSKEPWLLKPAKLNFTGYIVGKRNVIMSEFKPTYGNGYGEDYEQGYVSGKTEWVWLVAASIKNEPLIVRDCDICGTPRPTSTKTKRKLK